jgi:urea transport system substrate-binding protein
MPLLFICLSFLFLFSCETKKETIKVGILHSLTGTMAVSEKAVIDATILAIEEINAAGGILGAQIEPFIYDGQSDPKIFAKGAEELINKHKVSVIFGCWTSASRKTIKPIIEKYNNLLFYPVQYEGLENSPNIIYTGATPNQQITPALRWVSKHLGKRLFLVGSDYIFPHAANEIIKDYAPLLNATIVEESYLLLGSTNVDIIIKKIKEVKPDVILNTINGSTNSAFFNALEKANISIPIMSFSIAENELQAIKIKPLIGNYTSWTYFQSISTPENDQFISKVKKKYGNHRVTDDPMEAGYIGVKLWEQAALNGKSVNPEMIRTYIKGGNYNSPSGYVSIDQTNNHTWKSAFIGQIKKDGQFKIVWRSEKPIRPEPFPKSRTRKEWNFFLEERYKKWNNSWANSGEIK